jgi:hypothetical protein
MLDDARANLFSKKLVDNLVYGEVPLGRVIRNRWGGSVVHAGFLGSRAKVPHGNAHAAP